MVRRVVIRLDVRVAEGHAHALNDGHELERGLKGKRIGENVSRGNVDGLLEEIVLEHDEAGVDGGGVAENVVPAAKDLLRRRRPLRYLKVYER